MTEPNTPANPAPPTPPTPSPAAIPMGIAGALLGAALGTAVMYLGLRSGFYAQVAIGLLSGWLAGTLAKHPSWTVGAIAGVITALVGIWAEWQIAGPMLENDSFRYFVTHLHELRPFKLLSHAIGIGAAIWLGARR